MLMIFLKNHTISMCFNQFKLNQESLQALGSPNVQCQPLQFPFQPQAEPLHLFCVKPLKKPLLGL